jgi:hypothetical protein
MTMHTTTLCSSTTTFAALVGTLSVEMEGTPYAGDFAEHAHDHA